MELPKVVSEDDPSSRLYTLAMKVSQRNTAQTASEAMTIGHLKEISALLTHEGQELDKYPDTLEELMKALYKLIQSRRHLLFPELVNIINLAFAKCPLSINSCADQLISHLLPILNSVDPKMVEQADNCISRITLKTSNLLVVPEIGKFHEINPQQRLRTACYMKNLIHNYPLTELGNCPIDMNSIFNTFFESSFLDPSLEIKITAMEALAIFKIRFPKTLRVSKEVLKEIKKLERKVRMQRSPKQETQTLISFTAAHKNNFSLQRVPEEIEGFPVIQSFSGFGIDIESANSLDPAVRRREFENIFQKIKNVSEMNRVLEHPIQRNELFKILICHIADDDSDVQLKALYCLHIVLCESDYKLETSLLIEQVLEIGDNQVLKNATQSLMHVLLIKDFESDPYVFIKHSFSEKFRENFEDLYEIMFDRLSQNKLTQVILVADGGIKLILDQNKERSDAFTLSILLLLVQFGISSKELEQLLELINEDPYRSLLSEALMQSAQALTYPSPDQDNNKFIDKPSSFFLFVNKSFIDFELTEKANTILFWFYPTLQMEYVRFIDIRGKSNHLQVQLKELNLVLSIDKKKSQVLKNVVRIDCWNSFVLTLKSKSHFIAKKFECLMYCNNHVTRLSTNDSYDFSKVEIGEKSPFFTEKSKQNCFKGLLTAITCLEEFVPANKLNQLVVDSNDDYAFPRQSSYEKTLKLKLSSLFSHPCRQISPTDLSVNVCCKRVVLTSLVEAFKAIGGLGRLLKPLEESNIQIQIIEVVNYISRSKHFHSLIFPHFFEYIGLIISKTNSVPADYLLVVFQFLKKNLSSHPALIVEIVEGILLNKDLWNKMDLTATQSYVDTFKSSISAIENPSLIRLFNVFSAIIPKGNYAAMVDLIMSVLLDDRNQKQFEDSLIVLLNRLQNTPDFHQVYEHLLEELHSVSSKISISLKKKLATLMLNVRDEKIELNLVKLIWSYNKNKTEILDIINSRLKSNRLFYPTFEFLLGNVGESGNKPLLNIITSRLPHNSDVLPFLREINSRKNSKLSQEIVCVNFPTWLSSIFIKNYPNINEVTEEVFQVITNSLTFKENVKSKYIQKVSEFLINIGKPDAIYACYHFFLNTISDKLQVNKILFLGLLGVLEDILMRNQCYSIRSEISRYSELLQRIIDLGIRSHLHYCSRPITPELPFDWLRTSIKFNPQFSKSKVYLKEGGFIRLMLHLNLIGLYYEMNSDFVRNIELLLGGDSLFSEISTDKYTYNSSMWNGFIGYSSAYSIPEGKDYFFDPVWISLYILTESVEILMKHATPGCVFSEFPLVKLLDKILKEINLFYSEHFKASNLTEEEITAFNYLATSDYSFDSTLSCRPEEMQSIIEQRKTEILSNKITLKTFHEDLSSFEESISRCERNIEKVIRVLLYENDYFYLKRIHLFFLAKISGKLNFMYNISQHLSQRPQSKAGIHVIRQEVSMAIPEDEDDYDLYNYFIQKSYQRYLKIATSISNQAEFTELIQVRNIYDSIGRRFLLKPQRIKEDHFVLERAVKFPTFDCEKVKVEGNYLGKLILTKRFFYFESTGTVSQSYKGTAPEHAQIKLKKSNIYHVSEIFSIHPRRYLLQHTSIEVYLRSGRRIFYNLYTPEARQRFYNFASAHWHKLIELHTRKLIESRAESYSRMWQNGELSNFEYLMRLNQLASRSGNDITQYPIFPCIIKNFHSSEFNIDNVNLYRIFEFPVGAQTESMREEVKMKFSLWIDSSTKAFHYGTHYSTEGVTTHYMFRLEPFTTQAKNLQGGSLDAGDRLFSSMERAWVSSQSQIGDVKELIPELFYLPEMFLSKGRGPFSYRQDGIPVDSLELPAWAHNYFDFILKHMKALEFTHVKTSLKNWIDLIFGIKQSGDHAVQACNVFYETSYEEYFAREMERLDSEDIDKIVNFVFNFGQTPIKLFNKEHPRLLKVDTDMFAICLRENLIEMTPINIKSVRRFWQIGKDIFAISSANGALYLTKAEIQRGSILVNTSIKLEKANLTPIKTLPFLQQYCTEDEIDTVMTPRREHYCIWQGTYLVSAGYHDSSFKLHKLDTKYIRSVFFHPTIVTAVASESVFLFTGSLDGLVAGWVLKQKKTMAFYSSFYGHKAPISIIASLVDHCLIASLASNGVVIIHEIRTGECLRVLKDKNSVSLFGSELGFFISFSENNVTCFNANGYEESFTPSIKGTIKKAQIINDGEFVMVSTNHAIVAIYKLFEPMPLFEGRCGNSYDLLVSTSDERIFIYYSQGSSVSSQNRDSRRNSEVRNLIY